MQQYKNLKNVNAMYHKKKNTHTHLKYLLVSAKVLVVELEFPHVQSAWGCREKEVRVVGLAACYN